MASLDVGWVDIALAAFLLLSIVVGLVRGVVFEVLSLAGLFAAYFAALALAPTLPGQVPVGEPGSGLNYGVTFAAVFLVALVAWSLGARFIRMLIRATPLSVLDRILGAGFGVVRGVALLLVVAVVVGVSPWSRSPAWQQSQGAEWLDAVWQELRPFFINENRGRPVNA